MVSKLGKNGQIKIDFSPHKLLVSKQYKNLLDSKRRLKEEESDDD